MSDEDLTYKLEFQAALNAGNTQAQLAQLQERVDGLIQANRISVQTWEEVDTALEAAQQRLRDYSTAVPTLVEDQKLLSEWAKNQTAALKEQAAAQKVLSDAEKAAAAQAKANADARAAAFKQIQQAAEMAAAAQQKLDDQMLNASTLASRTNFNSAQAARGLVNTAATRIPAYATNAANTDGGAALRYNEQIYALQKRLSEAQVEYNARIRESTATFREQLAVAQEENGVVGGAKLSQMQEQLRQSTVGATAALKEEVAQISAAGKALRENNAAAAASRTALNTMGTTSRGGGGASFAALYLQEQAFQKTGAALGGLALTAVKTSAEYEAAFANVARTTDVSGKNAVGNIEAIRQGLMKLDTQIPMTFTDLSKIAAMGNELGVSASSILAFTKTVAEYSTLTGTAADTTANALGSLNEILHLGGNEYNNLGSAISYVGRMSVASEPEIVSMLQKMASTATQAGMTKQEVVGLAGAMASLKEAPERAQSALQNYTKVLDTALAQGAGSAKVAKWADALGMTPEQVENMAQTDATGFMEKFLSVLNSQNQVGKTAIFADLGLNNTRVNEVFSRLSANIPLVKKLIDDANSSWAKGTDLQTQYAKATDTLQASWTKLKDAVQNLMADIGDSGIGKEMKIFVDGLLKAVEMIDDLVKRYPKVAQGIATFAALSGAVLLVRGAMLGVEVVAKAFTFFDAANVIKITGFGSALKALAFEMGLIKVAAPAAVAGLEEVGAAAETAGAEIAAGEAEATFGITLIIAGLVALATWLLTDFPGAMKFAVGVLGWFIDGIKPFAGVIAPAIQDIARMAQVFLASAEIIAVAGAVIGSVAVDSVQLFAAGAGAIGQFVGVAIQDTANLVNAVVALFSDVAPPIAGMVQAAFAAVGGFINGIIQMVAKGISILGQMFPAVKGVSDAFDKMQGSLGNIASGFDSGDLTSALDNLKSGADGWASSLKDVSAQTQAATPDAAALTKALDGVGGAGNTAANGLGNTGNAAGAAAKQVRTLADYANDLSGVLTRAFDIQFGPTQANDAIISSFDQMRQNALSAADAVKQDRDQIQKLRADMAASQADIVKQKYFLSVASSFGDSLRASQISSTITTDQSNVSSDQTQIGTDQTKLATDIDKATASLAGNTAGAAANREALIGLVQKYQDYIAKLAASGANQKTLTAKTAEAKAEFIKQATQLGFNKTAVDKVATAFDHMTTVVKGVPRNITVSVNNNPAITALNEFAAKAASTARSVKGSFGGIGGISLPKLTDPTSSYEVRRSALEHEIGALESYMDSVRNGYLKFQLSQQLTTDRHNLANGNFWSGGYTGPGGKYEPAGVVHRGEYVVPSQYVNQSTGLPYADALGRLVAGIQPAQTSYANGGYVNPGMQIVELGPKSLAAVRDVARQEAVAVISSGALTGAVNSTNRINRRRGKG